jgi:hypothetical protein
MATITFSATDTTHPGRLEAVLEALRAMLDAFVSDRIRLAAAAAEHARPRREASSPLTNAR